MPSGGGRPTLGAAAPLLGPPGLGQSPVCSSRAPELNGGCILLHFYMGFCCPCSFCAFWHVGLRLFACYPPVCMSMICKTQLCTTCGTWLAILIYMSKIYAFPPLCGLYWRDKYVDKNRQHLLEIAPNSLSSLLIAY